MSEILVVDSKIKSFPLIFFQFGASVRACDLMTNFKLMKCKWKLIVGLSEKFYKA